MFQKQEENEQSGGKALGKECGDFFKGL